MSALFLPVVGAIADRMSRKKVLMCGFAWVGALAACCMVFVGGGRWALGALLLFIGNLCLGSSLVVYDSILIDIAPPDQRDTVSSRAWAFGYAGGFILLLVNLAVVTAHDALGMSQGTAVRLSLLSAGLWWGAFTFIPYVRLRNRPPTSVEPVRSRGLVRQSFGQLSATLKHLRSYPMTLLFLVAYLFFNDGIQTVISVSSTYGEKQLGFATQVLIATILLVQFVAFFGALAFGRFAQRYGAHRTITGGLVVWMLIVIAGFLLPAHQIVPFLVMGIAIGIVLGGTQALSRSAFSQLIPKGREAEYFSPLPGRRARHLLARHPRLRARPPAHRLLPPGHRCPRPLLPHRPDPADPRRHAPRHHRSRQRPARNRLAPPAGRSVGRWLGAARQEVSAPASAGRPGQA